MLLLILAKPRTSFALIAGLTRLRPLAVYASTADRSTSRSHQDFDPEAARRELDDLDRLISQHDDNYYGGYEKPVWPGLAPIPDDEYDALVRRAALLEEQYLDLRGTVKKLRGVGSKPQARTFTKLRHSMPMLSLNNAFTLSDVEKFLARIASVGVSPDLVVEPKIDGLSLSLLYAHGKLLRAGTRGDGFIGEDVTLNAKEIIDVPVELSLPAHFPPLLEVRGEVYLTRTDFERLNDERLQSNGSAFSTPRNTAAGSLRQEDPAVTRERRLRFFAYAAHGVAREGGEFVWSERETERLGIPAQDKCLRTLQELGFSVAQPWQICIATSAAEVFKVCRELESRREQLDFDIDGAVIKVPILHGFILRLVLLAQ